MTAPTAGGAVTGADGASATAAATDAAVASDGASDAGAGAAKPPTRAELRRVRVLATSAEIFGRQGFRGTSMNDIAAAVGLSKPTLYHYFRSKDELLVCLYTDVLDESLEAARATVDAASTPLAAIRDLLASRVVYTCENKDLLKVCFEEEHELTDELAEQVLARRRAFEDLFAGALAAHLARYPHLLPGIVPKVYVNSCLGAVNWVYKWYNPAGPATPAELGREIAAALTAAIDVPRA